MNCELYSQVACDECLAGDLVLESPTDDGCLEWSISLGLFRPHQAHQMGAYQAPHQVIPLNSQMQPIVKHLRSEALRCRMVGNLTTQVKDITMKALESRVIIRPPLIKKAGETHNRSD